MLFELDGHRYDTTHMRQHVTGDSAIPLVYYDESEGAVFVVTYDAAGVGVSVHRAQPAEIKELAARFGIPGLPGGEG